MEAVFHGALPSLVWKNILSAYAAKGVIDLSAGSGEGCKAAMSLRKPCLAFCFNDVHVRLLFDHLVDWMLASMADQKTVYFNAGYLAYKSGKAQAAPKPPPTPLEPPPTPKDNKDPKKKRASGEGADGSRKKKKRRGKSSSSSSSSVD